MKKITSVILAIALIFALAVTAMAAEIADCTVSADSVSATAGGTVTVPIRISGNRGFTNFGIALDYDREQLELLSIQTAEGETPYLCGTTVAVNTQWTGTDEKTFGYVTAALEEAATADGILSGSVGIFPAMRRCSRWCSICAATNGCCLYLTPFPSRP